MGKLRPSSLCVSYVHVSGVNHTPMCPVATRQGVSWHWAVNDLGQSVTAVRPPGGVLQLKVWVAVLI